MVKASTPPSQTIAAVLTDVDGTLVTKTKAPTPHAIEAIERLHERRVLFAITSGRPPRGMRMLVHPLEMRGPMAAFNGGIIVLPDMTTADERPLPDDLAPAVIDLIRVHGLYVWIYRGVEWYLTDPHAPHAQHEASTVRFQATIVPSYDGPSIESSRSSELATTTTWSRGAPPPFMSGSGRMSRPRGRGRTTWM